MGNATACRANKAQLIFDAARDIADVADEWMGVGLLTVTRHVEEGQLRLGVDPLDLPKTRRCKQVGKRGSSEEPSPAGTQRGTTSRSSGSSKNCSSLDAASRCLAYDVSDADVDCRRFEVLVLEGSRVARTEQDIAQLMSLFSGCANKDDFIVSVRMETCSVTFKRCASPFRDAACVEEGVIRMLGTEGLDLVMFASNYGNAVVEKVFCGGLLSMRFLKATRGGAAGADASEVNIGSARFSVSWSQRGGDEVLGMRGVALEQFERHVRHWCKSVALEQVALRGRTAQVVRLKLAPFSRVEGINVPPALARMDFDSTASCERAREGLKRAGRTRKLAELRAAVDEANAAGLDDRELETLQERRLALDAALQQLQTAVRQAKPEAVRFALARGEELGLREWEADEYQQAEACLATLEEAMQKQKLVAAANAEDIRLEDLVAIVSDAFTADYARLPEFEVVQEKLVKTIEDLTHQAEDDSLDPEHVEGFVEVLGELPLGDALSPANLASRRFAEAVLQLRGRATARQNLDRRREEAHASLRALVDRGEATHGLETHYDELGAALRDAHELLGEDGGGAGASQVHRSLAALKDRGLAVLEEKRTMEDTAKGFETRLRDACLVERCETHVLESVLQDLAVKESSGALHRASVSANLADSARKQLHSLLRVELDTHLEKAQVPGAAVSGLGLESVAVAKQVLRRMEVCRAACEEEHEVATQQVAQLHQSLVGEQGLHRAREEAREKLRHCLGSGDPHCLEDALRQAKSCGVPETHTLEAEARLRELQVAERQVQSALEQGDRVHLSKALEEASRKQLKTRTVDEALQRLQSSKTQTLVAAIRQGDYFALRKAIAEAESRSKKEVAEISDVLEQAKSQYRSLDSAAQAVSRALGTLSYQDLSSSVKRARDLGVLTDDVGKAEGLLKAMDHALGKLHDAGQNPRDLDTLQESLHCARQQGLQGHPVYKDAEDVFAGSCMPASMEWALEEQREMWVLLCLRRPRGAGPGEASVAHPFSVVIAELCHHAQLSPESEPVSVQFIHYALRHLVGGWAGGRREPQTPSMVQQALHTAWGDFSGDPVDGPPSVGDGDAELALDAHQFNQIGVVTLCIGLTSTAHLLWWLVCILEWETGQRLLLSFVAETARRTADLMNEAESTARSLRTHMMGLQARSGPGAPEDEAAAAAAEAAGLRAVGAPEIAPETLAVAAVPSAPSADARISAMRSVLEEIDQVKREAERLQGTLDKEKASVGETSGQASLPDLRRTLESVQQANPHNLEEARLAMQVRQREAFGRSRDLFSGAYDKLEACLLQLQYKGRQAVDGEQFSSVKKIQPSRTSASRNTPLLAPALPLMTVSPRLEAASSLQDHAYLQLLGLPEPSSGIARGADRCFLRVEVYERFSERTGAVEDEFEKLCRSAVTEARQRCGGRRLVAALKPLLIDLVKRRQRISSMLNTLRNCGLDKFEKNLLRKHLKPRDVLIALTFSSMPLGASQARMMALVAKTDSPLPLLFGWAAPATSSLGDAGWEEGSTDGAAAAGPGGLQLCTQIHWGALRELFCSPSHPLVLSVGTRATLGKSYLLQYLYALQECHFRCMTDSPLRIHTMPSIDIIGDFAREESLRGVTLADVHSFDPGDELCQTLTATLAGSAELVLLHVSVKLDFIESGHLPSEGLIELLDLLTLACSAASTAQGDASGAASPRFLVLLRDSDPDDSGPAEQARLMRCLEFVVQRLAVGSDTAPDVLVWFVPPLMALGQAELTNEVKTLRKSRAHRGATSSGDALTLEEALGQAAKFGRKFSTVPVLQERYDAFSQILQQQRGGAEVDASSLLSAGAEYGSLAQRVFGELGTVSEHEGLLPSLFPVGHCHQQLTTISQQRQQVLNRSRDYLEPEDRRRLENSAGNLDREIAKLKLIRQQAPPHMLLKTFGQLVLAGDCERIMEFAAYLNDWKQLRRAPLLEQKLRYRKELDKVLEASGGAEADDAAGAAATKGGPGRRTSGGAGAGDADGARVMRRLVELRGELASLQQRLDEVDVSIDSFWLELMLWHEMERIGARPGLREIDDSLTFAACKACYLRWVRNGNPVHFLHSAPLQFGAFEPLRWHPQLSGASLFGSDFIGDIMRELDRDLGVDVRRRPLLVISVIGVQSSGKSTLMNYLFGCSFATHVGRCTKGLYISLLETKRELIVILDTEGLLSVEARDDVFDKQVALMTMACSDLVIVNNRGELGRHVGDLFQVCLFALYHLKLARISPAIGFVLQCLSMVNQQQQYEWVATVKKSLEESVQELQQKDRPQSFKLQDLVFLDSESIFVMPSAFNDDVQYGLQVSRPTNLYALKALQLREKVFQWIGRAKASQKQRLREMATAGPAQPDSGSASTFASLSQWYDHARTVWQTLSMCGTDLLQFRTMRQVLMAQQLQEFCDALVQKHINERMAATCEALVERHSRDLRSAASPGDVHSTDNAFRASLDALRDSTMQEMQHEFDEFVKAHSTKFTDEQVKNDKRFSLMGPMRRKYASVDSSWRSTVHLAMEKRTMDHLFEEISARVTDLLLEQGAHVNVQNVERVFEEKWSQVMAEALQKQRPNLQRVVDEVICHFNAALSNLKSQFRKAHIFHGVKALTVHEVGTDVEICSSFLMSKKGVGDALVPAMIPGLVSSAKTQVDNLWIKLVDSMRLEIDQQGQMSDAAAMKILNRLNTEMESGDQLRQLMHRLGSSFVHRVFIEIGKATMHYRFQIEQQNFQSRISEILGKKQQKLWEIQARVDSGKREVHCAKVWAKAFVDTLDGHFKSAVGRMAQEIVSHIGSILTNPSNACEMAIERSFTKRNWRHVVMYAIDPTQYLFMEFHKEWEQFKSGLVDQYCQELKNNFGSCLRLAEHRLRDLLASGALNAQSDMTMNCLSKRLKEACSELADESLAGILSNCLPSFSVDADWPLENLVQFVQFATMELQRYRANMRQTEISVERRMEVEIARQKANCWKCICGCTARCPGCGTKCNLENENHWPERPHECRRHLYPAFNGWQKQEGRKPFLLHCRARAQWQIARTRPPIEPGGQERYWDNFQEMLEDEHPDWLDPATRQPLPSMEPLHDYEEDCTSAPEDIQREIEENRRAWANCKDALLEHFTSMADDKDLDWLEKYKREGGALNQEDFNSIRDELFAITPLECLDMLDQVVPVDDAVDGHSPVCKRC